ncbi:MAG: hypothetical protein U9R73_00680 [Pseudomonadota bacterium]|nr:hypothetical protein [Pseudomonadota bacterium]
MPRGKISVPARIYALLKQSERQWTRGEIAEALGIQYMSAHSAIVSMKSALRPEYREVVATKIRSGRPPSGGGRPRLPKPDAEPIDEPDYRPAVIDADPTTEALNAAFKAMERKPEPDWRWDWRRERPPTQTGLGRAGDVP